MDQPVSRFYHAGAKTEESIVYIYGGTNIGRENKLLGDMYKYDYSKCYIYIYIYNVYI